MAARGAREPAAHDLWDVKASPDIDPKATKIAKGVLQRIRAAVNEFAKEFTPPPVKEGRRLNVMAAILSKFMHNKPIVPPAKPEPITIHFADGETMHVGAPGTVYVTAGVGVGLAASCKQASMPVTFRCDVRISEDESLGGTPWACDVVPGPGASEFTRTAEGAWVGELMQGTTAHFTITSHEFDDSWTAVVRPVVTKIPAGGSK